MRKSFSRLISDSQDGVGDTSSAIKTFLKRHINERYETATDKLNTWTQSITRTLTSGTAAGADQQYYYNPPNLREIESIVVEIGDKDYPLSPVYSQEAWDALNAEPQAEGAYPCKYFRRANDYGIYPFNFEDDGTITITYTQRAVPLYFEDYTTGTVAVTENNQSVTITTGNTTTLKAGFWFTLTDSSGEPRGSWYRIESITSSSVFKLETFFEELTESGATFIVGQSPEIPEEGHKLLAIGAIADFYLLKAKDVETGTRFENIFWMGSPNITPLQAKNRDELGGLLGLISSYKDRDSSVVVNRSPAVRDLMDFQIPTTVDVS